jgi:hypothetical protein
VKKKALQRAFKKNVALESLNLEAVLQQPK